MTTACSRPNCDTVGFGLSRQAIAAAGVTQGQQVTVPGTALHFTLPTIPAGQPDNATGDGQTIALHLPADATSISFVGTGTEGNQNTTGVATFSDGTTASIPIQFSDWTLGGNPNSTPAFGNIVVAKTAYRLAGTSKDSAQPFLLATVPYQIPAGKTLVSVTLPTQTGDPSTSGRIHVFAIADDGTPSPALAVTAPATQTANAGQAFAAQLGSVSGGVTDAGGYHATRAVGRRHRARRRGDLGNGGDHRVAHVRANRHVHGARHRVGRAVQHDHDAHRDRVEGSFPAVDHGVGRHRGHRDRRQRLRGR